MPRICKPYRHKTDAVLIRSYVLVNKQRVNIYLGKYTGVLDVLLFNADGGRHDIMKQAGLGGSIESGLVHSVHRMMCSWQGGGGRAIIQSDIHRSSQWSPPRFPPLEDEWLTGGGQCIRQSDLGSASITEATDSCIDCIIAPVQRRMCILHPIQPRLDLQQSLLVPYTYWPNYNESSRDIPSLSHS